MAYLSDRSGSRVLISEVSQAMAIPRAFLSKIMKELVRGGLVTSQVGPGGGYELARPASEITFREIMAVVEGEWVLVPCQGAEDTCLLHKSCSQVGVWDEIRSQMLTILSNYTLASVRGRPLGEGANPLVQLSGVAG
jgi:Rrf2 family protein